MAIRFCVRLFHFVSIFSMCFAALGNVKWFSDSDGIGIIIPENGGNGIFVHQSGIQRDGLRTLHAGERVRFGIIDTEKGFVATNVVPFSNKH